MQTTGRGRRNCEDRKRAMKEGKLSERRRASLNALLVSFVIGSLSLLLFFSYSSSPFVFADELLAQEAEMEKRVTCGSAIKLTHTATKAKLHSHGIGYGSGSGQQSVTGFPESNDPGGVLASVWNARGAVRTRRGHRGRSRDSVAARADEEVVTLARGA